jgi:uncharacterized protein YodC (DUF2158 family)
MAAIEAFRRGDEVCTKASGGPIMTVLAVEGLKVRCADGENLQYWFDTAMLERYKQSQRHSEVSSVAIYESVNTDGLEPSNARHSYLRCETFADETIMDAPVELRSDFWIYVEQLLRTPQTLAA